MITRGHFLRQNLMTGDFDEDHSKAELQSKSSAIRMDEDRRQGNEEMDRVWLAEKKNSARKERFQNCKMNHMRSMVKAWGDGLTNTFRWTGKILEKEHFSKIQKKMALIYLVSVNEEIVKGWPCWNATCNLLSKAGSLSSEDQTIVDMASHDEVKDLWVAEEIRKISTKRKSASNYCKLSAWSVCFFLCLSIYI